MNKIWLLVVLAILVFACKNSTVRKPIVKKTSTDVNQSILLNKKLNELEENVFKIFMKKDSLNTYFSSDKGFWYKYINKSTNTHSPKFGDLVNYTYAVFDSNNNPIYTADDLGEKKYLVDQQEIPEGIRNGIKLMHEGDNILFLFPSHKMYGYVGDGNKIKRNKPLIIQIKLIKINKNEIK